MVDDISDDDDDSFCQLSDAKYLIITTIMWSDEDDGNSDDSVCQLSDEKYLIAAILDGTISADPYVTLS